MVGAPNYGHTSVITVEGQALRDGIQAVIEAGYTMLDIKGDNFIIIGRVDRDPP